MSSADSLNSFDLTPPNGPNEAGDVVNGLRSRPFFDSSFPKAKFNLPKRTSEIPLREQNIRHFLSLIYQRFCHQIPAELFLETGKCDKDLMMDILTYVEFSTFFPNGSIVLVPVEKDFLREIDPECQGEGRFGERVLVKAIVKNRVGSIFEVDILIGDKKIPRPVYLDSLLEYGNMPYCLIP